LTSQSTLKLAFRKYGTLAGIYIHHGDGENYAFINYLSPADAQMAANEMDGVKINGMPITVKVQGQKVSGRSSSSSGDYTVKITNLSKRTTEETLRNMFSFSGEVDTPNLGVKINKTESTFNYAYVNYTNPSDAERAERELNGLKIDGSIVKVRPHFSGEATMGSPPVSPTRPLSIPQKQYHQPLRASSLSPRGYSIPIAQTHSPTNRSSIPTAALHPTCISQTPISSQVTSSHPPHMQSNTVKVSIHGDLTGEDIEEFFSQFGVINEKPIVHPGTPKYAYINFQNSQEALAACKQNIITIMGTRVHVKVSEKVGGGGSIHECKPFACDSLVARLLTSKDYQDKLEKIEQTHKVRVKRMKSGNGVNFWGDPQKFDAVEMFIELLAEDVAKRISKQAFTLPCLVVPLFQNQQLLEQAMVIEEKYGIEFCLLDRSTECPLSIAEFRSRVSNVFSSARVIPDVSCFSKYLTPRSSITTSAAMATEYLWLWEDDSGGYTPYSPETCSTLSKVFAAYPQSQFQCKVVTELGRSEYTIDFASMTQTNAKSGKQRSIKYQSGTPTWLYQDDHKQYTSYSPQDSAEIEKMYKSRIINVLTINGRQYKFDLDNMKQVNVDTQHKRSIQRQLTANTIFAHATQPELSFEVRGITPNLQLAVDEFRREVMADLVIMQHPLTPEGDETFKSSLLQTTSQYLVDAKITGDTIELKGIQSYVDKVLLQVRQETLAYKEKVLVQRSLSGVPGRAIDVPSHWEAQTEKVVLKPVRSGSREWNGILSKIRQTLPSAQVAQVERIQNLWLWEKYCFSKQRMSEKYRGITNEKELFHGTSSTPPEKIFRSEQGFDFRFCSRGMWGTGAYFAVNASYSNNYAYTIAARKQIILAKVLTGETIRCNPDSSLKKPPVKSRSRSGSGRSTFEDELYDSVSGNTNGSDIFVIYDHEKAYPAYLITYKTAST